MWDQQYTDSVVHFLSNGAPNSVRLGISGTSSQNALAQTSFFVTDTWRINRLTLNVGARFDRYRVWLPAQEIPAARFSPAAVPLPENSNVVDFNNIVPRLGATYDLTGDGKTVLKANWGRFYFNPGVSLADAINPNTSQQYADYNWNDINGDSVFQDGETVGAPFTVFGGTSNVAIDPDSTTDNRRKLVLHRARGPAGPRRSRRLCLQEGQPGLGAVQRRPPVRSLQRAGDPARSWSGQRRWQRR